MSKNSSLFSKNYQPVHVRARKRVTLDFNSDILPSMTEQHHEPNVNLNKLYAKYMSKGLPSPNLRTDGSNLISDGFDFMTTQLNIIEAKERFELFSNHFNDLPSNVRRQFNNKPEDWLNHLLQPGSIDEAIKQGHISFTPLSESISAEKAPQAQKGAKSRESASAAGSNPLKGGEEQGA